VFAKDIRRLPKLPPIIVSGNPRRHWSSLNHMKYSPADTSGDYQVPQYQRAVRLVAYHRSHPRRYAAPCLPSGYQFPTSFRSAGPLANEFRDSLAHTTSEFDSSAVQWIARVHRQKPSCSAPGHCIQRARMWGFMAPVPEMNMGCHRRRYVSMQLAIRGQLAIVPKAGPQGPKSPRPGPRDPIHTSIAISVLPRGLNRNPIAMLVSPLRGAAI
jgi:hypothetical protein